MFFFLSKLSGSSSVSFSKFLTALAFTFCFTILIALSSVSTFIQNDQKLFSSKEQLIRPQICVGTQTYKYIPITVGSKSTITTRGTHFPPGVVAKKALWLSSILIDEWNKPSGIIPCSRQYNSQQALAICTPAWPMCIWITSRCKNNHLKISHRAVQQKRITYIIRHVHWKFYFNIIFWLKMFLGLEFWWGCWHIVWWNLMSVSWSWKPWAIIIACQVETRGRVFSWNCSVCHRSKVTEKLVNSFVQCKH